MTERKLRKAIHVGPKARNANHLIKGLQSQVRDLQNRNYDFRSESQKEKDRDDAERRASWARDD